MGGRARMTKRRRSERQENEHPVEKWRARFSGFSLDAVLQEKQKQANSDNSIRTYNNKHWGKFFKINNKKM